MEGLLDEDVDLSEMLGLDAEEPDDAHIAGKVHNRRKSIVCSFWLIGLCKKSDDTCDYLHRYDCERIALCRY